MAEVRLPNRRDKITCQGRGAGGGSFVMTMRGKTRLKREPQTAAAALARGAGHLMRQVRKFAALRACFDALPPELSGLAAPYDVRQAVGSDAGTSVLCIYALSPTVEAALKALAPALLEAANAGLPYPLVQDVRIDSANKQKIERQVNILRAKPD